MHQGLFSYIMSLPWKQLLSSWTTKEDSKWPGLFRGFGAKQSEKSSDCCCLWEQMWEGGSRMGMKLHLQKMQEKLCWCPAEQGSGGTSALVTVFWGTCGQQDCT